MAFCCIRVISRFEAQKCMNKWSPYPRAAQHYRCWHNNSGAWTSLQWKQVPRLHPVSSDISDCTPCAVHMHRVTVYVSNTLRKLMT